MEKSLLRENRVEYECSSETLVQASLIFSGVELLATFHMILQRWSKYIIKKGERLIEVVYDAKEALVRIF